MRVGKNWFGGSETSYCVYVQSTYVHIVHKQTFTIFGVLEFHWRKGKLYYYCPIWLLSQVELC